MESCTNRTTASRASRNPSADSAFFLFSLPLANCKNIIYLFLFISEGVIILAAIVIVDAENTSIVIIIRINNSVITIIKKVFLFDVDLIDIGIVRDDVIVDT